MTGTNGNGREHKTPVPTSTSPAAILRKIEGLPDDLKQLEPYELAAFAAFTVMEAVDKLEGLTQVVKADAILDRATAAKVTLLEEQGSRVASQADVNALRAEVVALKGDVKALGETADKHAEGILEAIGKAENAHREAHESDVDLLETVEREKAERVAEDARIESDNIRMRDLMAPIVADASRKAGNAGAVKATGTTLTAVIIAAFVAEPAETVKLAKELGPSGLLVAGVLLLVTLGVARYRRS